MSKTKRRAIGRVERAWEAYAVDPRPERECMNDLLSLPDIRSLITSRAAMHGRKWNSLRLSAHDFESAFWEAAWGACADYTWASKYHLYETINLAIKRQALDVTRHADRKKREPEHKARFLADRFEEEYADSAPSPEDAVVSRLTVAEMLGHWSLTDQERSVLEALYDMPDASLQQLADMCGLSSKMAASRIRDRLKTKLTQYNPYADTDKKFDLAA